MAKDRKSAQAKSGAAERDPARARGRKNSEKQAPSYLKCRLSSSVKRHGVVFSRRACKEGENDAKQKGHSKTAPFEGCAAPPSHKLNLSPRRAQYKKSRKEPWREYARPNGVCAKRSQKNR